MQRALFGILLAAALSASEPAWRQAVVEADRLQRAGEFTEAESTLLGALSGTERAGAAALEMGVALNNQAKLNQDMGRYDEAEKLYQQALSALHASPGSEKFRLRTANNLVCLYLERGQRGRAERFQERLVLPMLEAAKPESADQADAYHGLGAIHHLRREDARAEHFYTRALTIHEKTGGPWSPDVANVLNSFGLLRLQAGRYREALALLERCAAIIQASYGSDHPEMAKVTLNLASAYTRFKRPADADAMFQRSLALAESRLGGQHPLTAGILRSYAELLRRTGRKKDATAMAQRAHPILDHLPSTLRARHAVDVSDLMPQRKASSAPGWRSRRPRP